MSLLNEFALVERGEQYALPHLRLRELGIKNVPAVPVDIAGILDTLVKLGAREKQCELAYQGFTKTFTIGGTTARAHSFLFGDQTAGAQQAAARESLRAFLGSDPHAIAPGALAERRRRRWAHRARARRSPAVVAVVDLVPRRVLRGRAAPRQLGGDGGCDAAREGDGGVLPDHRARGPRLQPASPQEGAGPGRGDMARAPR